MKNLYRVLALALVLTMVVSAGFIIAAQDDEVPAPGEGGIIIQGNTRGSANLGSFIQIRCSGVDCRDSGGLMFPSTLGLDPFSVTTVGAAENDLGQLFLDWSISDDGLVYTFNIRQDAFWTDGEQITADDVVFTWNAIEQGAAIELSGSYTEPARIIENVEIIDDFTVAMTLIESSCTAVDNLNFPVDPAHAFGWTADMGAEFDWASYVDSPQNDNPVISAGPFQFFRAEPGTAIFLSANTDYYAPAGDYIVPQGWVFQDVLDDTVLTERFLSFQEGEPNFVFEPPAGEFEALRNSDAQYVQLPGTVWHYFSMNLADPTNAQNGQDADGNLVDQGVHPLFGDVLVRQALQHAIDIEEIILGAQNGDATAMIAGTIPSAFSLHPELERRPLDLDAARALLDEAGWVSTGDSLVDGGDGLRTCQGCATAEEGTEFAFDLMNPQSSGREDVAVLVQAQFAVLGVSVEVLTLDFNGMYDAIEAQTYDAAIAGWRGGQPFDPDQRAFFGSDNDVFSTTGEGAGFNFPSYQNAEVDALFNSVNTVPGCGLEDRLEIAYQIQEILWEDQPYLWLYSLDSAYAVAPNVSGFNPGPGAPRWNMDAWVVTE